jgi:hemoglobin
VSSEPVPAPGRRPPEAEREPTVFDAVGGRPFFDALVDRFYAGVDTDPRMRHMYPEDLTEPKRHLAGFLAQYWGGGVGEYSVERGHPRLRARHMPFSIGDEEAVAWLEHMTAALAVADLPAELEARFLEYFVGTAAAMRNR